MRVSIVGATGYTGFELVKILLAHKEVEISHLAVRREPCPVYSHIFPQLKGLCDKRTTPISADAICNDSDVIFFALPHKVTQTLMPQFIDKGKKIIDLSADYRLKNADIYKHAYGQDHQDIENIDKFVYGLSEINKDAIASANNIANPGCFPTSVLLALMPVLKSKIIADNNIIIDSKTGVSGGGRTPSLGFHFPECNESIKPYRVALHQHAPEMEQELNASVVFVPHLVPMTRGILSTIYTDLIQDLSEEEIRNIYKKYYENKFFVRILGEGIWPETKNVANTNFTDIAIKKTGNKLIITSAIDNLVKGAAGQAVENMNIMLGLDEKEGLV